MINTDKKLEPKEYEGIVIIETAI